ncbi:MAG: hypothetical protein FWG92_01585 [Leptospirales bacterium]|nr:hypothetical protein [Leptospirales bacterium]
MKKTLFLSIFLTITCISISASANYSKNDISKVIITEKDIPAGFIIGKLPEKAKEVLKDNPWYFDNAAIKRLTGNIYPDGNHKKIAAIHMTILANEKTPYQDNMVCWVILYKDAKTTKEELAKLRRYTDLNSDKSILIHKNNMVIFMYSNNADEFHYVQDIAAKIQAKIKTM